MKVTVDTNFFISSTQWDYSIANRLLKKLLERGIEIFSTKEILEEFLGILQRDFKYNLQDAEKIIEKVMFFVILVEPFRKIRVVMDDIDDDKIIECAVESDSDYILTYDKHLLSLREFERIKILTPEEFLRLLS